MRLAILHSHATSIVTLCVVCSLCLGCGDNTVSEVAITGAWTDTAADGSSTTIMLVQAGARVSGTFEDEKGWTGVIAGTVAGDSLDMTYTYSDGYVVRNTAQMLSADMMGGTFKSVDGAYRGTWTATRRPETTGTSILQGNIAAFDVMQSTLGAAVQGDAEMVVYLYGPVCRSTIADENGAFSFPNLPAGDYRIEFEYNHQRVAYRGNSGQIASISVEDDQHVELTEVRVNGGNVNIGNVTITQVDSEPGTDDSVPTPPDSEPGEAPKPEAGTAPVLPPAEVPGSDVTPPIATPEAVPATPEVNIPDPTLPVVPDETPAPEEPDVEEPPDPSVPTVSPNPIPSEAPEKVYVDDDFDSSTPGWQVTHFDTIQAGVNAVAIGGTVYIAAGRYCETVLMKPCWTEAEEGSVLDGTCM